VVSLVILVWDVVHWLLVVLAAGAQLLHSADSGKLAFSSSDAYSLFSFLKLNY
jgi:hypothetical protein